MIINIGRGLFITIICNYLICGAGTACTSFTWHLSEICLFMNLPTTLLIHLIKYSFYVLLAYMCNM